MTPTGTVKTCGAETRACTCGHHQQKHAVGGPGNKERTRRGACEQDGCKCQAFNGKRCKVSNGLRAGGRCRQHGGWSPMGVASPSYRGRGYSQHMPEHLRADYEGALADEQLLSLSREIALVKALVAESVRHLQGGEVIGPRAIAAWQAFQAAHRSGRADAMAGALTKLGEAMGDAARYHHAKTELRQSSLVLERLARSENMRLAELHNMVTAEAALQLQHALVNALLGDLDVIVTNAAERTALRRAAAGRLAELAGRRGDTDARSGRADGDVVDTVAVDG